MDPDGAYPNVVQHPSPYIYNQPSTSFNPPVVGPNQMAPAIPAATAATAQNFYNPQQSAYPTQRVPYPVAGNANPTTSNSITATNGRSCDPYTNRAFPSSDSRKMLNTQAWMSEHRFSNVAQQHSRCGSAPSSVMSLMSHVSSATEDMSLLSVNTQVSELRQLAELRNAPHHSSAPSSSSSCVENVDPNNSKFAQTVDNYLDKIITNINNPDRKQIRESLRALFLMATRNDFERANIDKLEVMMKALIQRWLRQNTVDYEIVDVVLRVISRFSADGKTKQVLSKWMVNYPDELLETFARWMDPKQKYCKYALNTVHSLVEMVDRSKYTHDVKEKIMGSVVGVMKEMDTNGDRYFIKTSKSKQYVFDLVRRIFNGSDLQRHSFETKDGIRLLLSLLRKEVNELVVYRIARALYALICSQERSFGVKFVQLDGIKIIVNLLANPHCSERVALDVMLSLRVISDLEDVRATDHRETISKILTMMGAFRTNAAFLTVAVDFLGNISASLDGMINANKDFIADCGIVEGLINLLSAFQKRRNDPTVKTLIVSIIWALHIFTAGCSTQERNLSVRKRLVSIDGAPSLLLYELTQPVDLTSRLYVINIIIRIIEADQLSHPSILFGATIDNHSFTDVLFEIIATTANDINANGKTNQKKKIIQNAYSLLILLANCSLSFGHAIRFACGSYQIWDILLSSDDADVVKSTIDFIMFVIKDEGVREQLAKDCSFVETVRNLTTEMTDNSSAAQFLLYHLTAESEPMVTFTPIL